MEVCICVKFQLIRHAFLQPIWPYWVMSNYIIFLSRTKLFFTRAFYFFFTFTSPSSSSLSSLYHCVAPAIRLVDEMGHEVSDRYYKLGSSVDITCQVALTFLNTLPPSSVTNLNDKFPMSLTTTTSTTTTFPFIDTNLIKKSLESIPYSGKHNIKWKKDGRDLPKDIKINLRFVMNEFLFSFFPLHSFHQL